MIKWRTAILIFGFGQKSPTQQEVCNLWNDRRVARSICQSTASKINREVGHASIYRVLPNIDPQLSRLIVLE